MKNQSETYKKVVDNYLKELKAVLICSCSMKQALLSTIKQRILELSSDFSALSTEDLYKEIGTPEEIARGLESRSDVESLKRKAKRYTIAKIVCSICLAFALLTAAILTIVVLSDNDYYMTTSIGY